ncbi:MAG: hypothetical protein AAFN10_08770, partial [Bacteroidota bacterium]
PRLPDLEFNEWEAINQVLNWVNSIAKPKETYILNDGYQDQAWENEPYVYRSPYSIVLNRSFVSGKVQLQSAGEIRVKANSQLQHTILIARSIYIESGFEGVVQAFASENITLEAAVKLHYPSVLRVQKHHDQTHIQIGANSQLAGAVILGGKNYAQSFLPSEQINIAKGAEIQGSVYGPNVSLQARVNGQVIADRFVLKHLGTEYRNFLLDGQIDLRALDANYVSPLIFGGDDRKLIEWL